ncbi:MAG: hypothetical protein HY717_08740 [Planctomycetes bacterium]|nr:hypothetical protein [Planctomycetota bacterium]
MKRSDAAVFFALVILLLIPQPAFSDLQSAVDRYLTLKAQLKKTPRGKREEFIKKEIQPKLMEIGKLDTVESLAFLQQEFSSADPDAAVVFPPAILANSSNKAFEVLLGGFGKRPPAVRVEVLNLLESSKRDLQPIETALLDLLQTEKQPEVYRKLPKVVGKLDSVPAARALLLALRAEPHGPGGGKAGEADQEFNRGVLEALRGAKNEAVKKWLAGEAFQNAPPARQKILARLAGDLKLAEARPKVIELFQENDDEVVSAAVEALEKIGFGSDLDKVAGLFKRGNRWGNSVRIQVLDALAASGDEKALQVVLESARSSDPEFRAIAMGSLSRSQKSPAAVESLLEGLKDSAPEVRNAALRSLGRFRVKAMVPGLIEFIGREHEEKLRLAALKFLISITNKNMGFEVADWRKWWDAAQRSFEFPKEEKSITSVKTYDLKYFGIEVTSKQLAFLADVSGSMLETVEVTVRSEGEKDGGEEKGKTSPVGGGEGKKEGGKAAGGVKTKAKKIDVLKKELTRVLEKLPGETSVNIVYFHANFSAWKKTLHPLAGSGRREAIAFVQDLKNGSGTNVFDTLEFALADKRVDTIYLLTDGLPTRGKYTDPAAILRQVKILNRIRGATLHCIAFGEESDLLKKLAAENHGSYRFVNSY